MKNILQLLTLFTALIFISSCKKDVTQPSFTDIPVIQSFLQVGSPASVTISKQIAFDPNATYSSDNVSTLNVTLSANGITYTLTPTGNGNYVDSSLIISDSLQYSMQFNYNSKSVTATTKALSKPLGYTQSASVVSIAQVAVGASSGSTYSSNPLPAPIVFNWTNTDHSYYIVVVENITTNPAFINLNNTDEPAHIFRSSPTQDNNDQLNARQFQYYGMHKITLYHILPDYADLYISNGTSSQNLATPQTNITNGYGIFTAMNSVVLYVNVLKL